MEIEVIRKWYYPQTTIGELFIDDRLFCYTLEDTVRPYNIKVPGHTAIPEDSYFVVPHFSTKFNRNVILLYNDETKTKCTNGKVSFTWIYFHGGNTHEDSSGCIIVAYNRRINRIQSSSEKDLYKKIIDTINKGEEVFVKVLNSPQKY